MSFESQKREIIDICKKILEEKQADCICAYREGGVEGMSVPIFIKDVWDTEKIKWDNRCVQNLAGYLHGRRGKTAIVAKPCDIRAIVNYIVEKQLDRKNIYIIGVDCGGMVDIEGKLLPGCGECRVHRPPICDVHVQNNEIADSTCDSKEGKQKLSDDLLNNLERFQKEMEKCILCYSCRQACYGCYCEICFIDRDVPSWEPVEPDIGVKMTYHLGRAMHLAGRCVECGACERACASGVNIRYLIQEVTNFIDEYYDYQTGLDLETRPAMLDFKAEDREIGFIGGVI